MSPTGPNVKHRLFIAAPVSPDVAGRLAEAVTRLRIDGVRWVDPANFHVTLKFLGPTPAERIPSIIAALDAVAAAHAPFAYRARGTGTFPGVIWAGIDDPANQLGAVAAALEKALELLGFSPETRAYVPHLTLGRAKKPIHHVKLTEDFGEVRVAQLLLMESITNREGPVYHLRHASPLQG
jgi:2'-5' RNA ligase